MLAAEAQAGIMLDGVSESQYLAFASQPQFAGSGSVFSEAIDQQTQQVIRVSHGSGTLIAPDWVLTAGHVGIPSFFQPGGTGPTYAISQRIAHPVFVANGDSAFAINFGFDVALLHLSTPVTSSPYANIYRGSNEVNLGAAITGFGVGGFGADGGAAGLPQASRAGTNRIDYIFPSLPIGPNGVTQAFNSLFATDFDSPTSIGTPGQYNTLASFGSDAAPSPLEYQLANQDSGGGVYVFENGNWFLAGINSGVQSQNDTLGTGNTQLFGYGALGVYTRVSSFQSFIDINALSVPEPGSFVLLSVIATVAIFARRRTST